MTVMRYSIEIGIYLFSFFISSYAVKAIPFHKFLDHTKVKEAWLLYILTVLALTFIIGSLIIKFIGLDLWLSLKN